MVKVEKLEKRYGDYKLNISLAIPEGRVTGIIGKNGAGKSTTIKAILGLISADAGSIKVFDKDVKELTAKDKEQIGVALAESGFSMYLKIKDICSILKKMYADFDAAYFSEQCKKLGLPIDKTIKDFSTGMKAKLRVLVAISHKAKLLILDEPTAGLDVEARMEILDMIRKYLAEDETRSLLISSHISSDLEGLCDDLYLLQNGNVILHEEVDKIISEYAVMKVSEEDYTSIDKQYIVACKKENYGYQLLTNEKGYYIENYPKLVIENANIDNVILLSGVQQ